MNKAVRRADKITLPMTFASNQHLKQKQLKCEFDAFQFYSDLLCVKL